MSDETEVLNFGRNSHLAALSGRLPKEMEADASDEEACAAFGYLRGMRERALAVEFRFKNGDSDWFPYNCLLSWRYNPSTGLLLKFSGDVVTLVLISGSNLDMLVNQTVNLTDRGFPRHRIVFVREMNGDELRKAGEGKPTIDSIKIAEFESHEASQEWLKKHASVFVR